MHMVLNRKDNSLCRRVAPLEEWPEQMQDYPACMTEVALATNKNVRVPPPKSKPAPPPCGGFLNPEKGMGIGVGGQATPFESGEGVSMLTVSYHGDVMLRLRGRERNIMK